MAAEGLEKITEIPVEFFKDGTAFIKKCQKPSQQGTYIWIIVKNSHGATPGTSDNDGAGWFRGLVPRTVHVRIFLAFRGELYLVHSVASFESFLWMAIGVAVVAYGFDLALPYYFSYCY